MSPRPSYVHMPGRQPLLGETVGENLRRTVERVPDSEALVVRHQGFRATYRQLWDQTSEAARALLARGVGRGDRVGIWSANRFEWVVLQYATARVGAILVNLNPALRAEELAHPLSHSGAAFLFLSRQYRGTDCVAALDGIRGACPALKQSWILEQDWSGFLSGAAHVSERELAEREATLQFDDPINLQYTSGTTGSPKGATLSHHNILNNGYFIGEALRYTEADRVCIPVPFFHCFGMVIGNLACTTHGACLVVPSEVFSPEATLEAVQAERCTSLYGVPTMFIAELEHPRFAQFDLGTLRTGVMAGSPCPVETMKQVQSRMNMREVTICYGMTETSPVSTQSAVDDPLEKRVASVGRVHPHLEVKIVEPETGEIVPRGGRGELCTRGYSVMLGYWNDPDATLRVIDPAGWMHTGDLATLDDDGYVNIVGRIKDVVIRGGENIYPRELEELLHTHPAVSEAQVIGVPSHRFGEEVMAWVKLKPDAAVTADQLKEFCGQRVARYKIPRYWKFVDAFPMTLSGKVQKFKMRELSVQELHLEADASVETA